MEDEETLMTTIDFHAETLFYELDEHELDELLADTEFIDTIKACIEVQKTAGAGALIDKYKPDAEALEKVSEKALSIFLKSENDRSDIRTDQELSNCLVFHAKKLKQSVIDSQVKHLRKQVDGVVSARVTRFFHPRERLTVINTGHLWYPPGSYMGWHTNSRNPGWRLYINHAEEPGKSFFRYRDPRSGRVITSVDQVWNVRLFRASIEKPLWHAVYSATNRFSLGYKVSLAARGRSGSG